MAVRLGSKNVYHSMSRVISLWLDLGSDVASKLMKDRLNNEAKETLKKQQAILSQIHAEVCTPCISIIIIIIYSLRRNAQDFKSYRVEQFIIERFISMESY